MIRKITFLLSICILSAILSACGGQDKRAGDIPTEQEALAAVENEFGIRGAKVLNVRDVRNEGSEYYGIDAIYTMTCDRIKEFTILRTWTYDALFWGGYYYSWITDYSDLVCDDYVRDHPLPEGIVYSVSPYARSDYGAKNYFREENKQIWFDFESDEVFEERLDALEPWLDEWLSYDRQYLTQGKDPRVQVVAHRAQDNTMNYSIQIYRTFGYEKDSFHTTGENGETYRWDSFQKAMRSGYLAKKKLVMK